ncbi:MAG: hypothetical protein NTU49_06665 [Gammaproteobacteria bacterium]|nr:hypothetical protein [Gammaproteobacteria bacterium]
MSNKIIQKILFASMIFFISLNLFGKTIENTVNVELISIKKGEYVLKRPIKITLVKAQKILCAYDKLYFLMPGIIHSTVKSSGKNYKILYQVYKADYTFGFSISAEILIRMIGPNEVQYYLLKSNRIHALSGDILLRKIDKRHVLVISKIDINPNMPFFLRSLFFKRFKNQLAVSDVKFLQFFTQ